MKFTIQLSKKELRGLRGRLVDMASLWLETLAGTVLRDGPTDGAQGEDDDHLEKLARGLDAWASGHRAVANGVRTGGAPRPEDIGDPSDWTRHRPDIVAPNDDFDLYSSENLERGYHVNATPKTPNQIAHQILATDQFDIDTVSPEITGAILAWWRGGPDPVAQVARLTAREVGEDRPFLLAALYAVEATVRQYDALWTNPESWGFVRDDFGDPNKPVGGARMVANTPTMLSALAGMQRQSDPATDAQLGEAILPRMVAIREYIEASTKKPFNVPFVHFEIGPSGTNIGAEKTP